MLNQYCLSALKLLIWHFPLRPLLDRAPYRASSCLPLTSHRISPSLVTSRMRSLGSSKHIFKMASRRKETRREEGFYGRLHRFSTAEEWNVLRLRSVVRRRKSEVFEVEIILGERKRKVREFPLFLCTRCIKLINLISL